ncbi:MAG TPA: hypothetical protein VD815_09520 [Candidatus Saccharimonadales bacterium]|nr:hypothetical protein [Candidatus Saccharimonadales bacterium]
MGITMLLFLIGMFIGPSNSGIYMESLKSTDNNQKSYPSALANDLIFVTAVVISITSIALTILITKRLLQKII